MENERYNNNQNYCSSAKDFQAVLSFEQYHNDNPDVPIDKIDSNRAQTLYSCPDNYQMGTIQDNQIYIATTDPQHDQIFKGEHVNEHGGLSGYFSDQATVDACKNGDSLDNTKYNEACQIAPHREGGISGTGDATYKPHIDCFEIDRDALYNNYGTYDFNAAVSKCEANNQFGSGGGNQGYNPYISEMIDNGTLKYTFDKSYSDKSISKSEHNNPNASYNSVVPEDKADAIYSNAQLRAQDCVNNNTPHPSPEACNNGFDKNDAITIRQSTGNAIISNSQIAGELPTQPQQLESSNNSEIAGALPKEELHTPVADSQVAGTAPEQAESINLSDRNIGNKAAQDLAEGVNKKAGEGVNSATGII